MSNFSQKIKKLAYPLLKKLAPGEVLAAPGQVVAGTSFYSLSGYENNGNWVDFEQLRNKKVLLVNTASQCGFTPQYGELQQLSASAGDALVLLAFPSNDFGRQEPGGDEAIQTFCSIHFGVSFRIMQKSVVRKGAGQHAVFEWLSHAAKNGWNDKGPQWNFSKYLVNRQGELVNYFSSAISPLGPEITKALKAA